MIPTRAEYAVAFAVVAYQYNTSGVQFVKDVFGDVHPNYAAEKAGAWADSPARSIGMLDHLHFGRFVEAALAKSRDEGLRRAEMAEAGL